MKYSEKFISHASIYTVVISLLFFLFARIIGLGELSISLTRYLLIFAFSLIISAAEFILTIEKLSKTVRYLIHYLSLLLSFFVLFISVKKSSGSPVFNAGSIFAAVVIFTAIYFISLYILRVIKSAANKTSSKKNKTNEAEQKAYSPRFK